MMKDTKVSNLVSPVTEGGVDPMKGLARTYVSLMLDPEFTQAAREGDLNALSALEFVSRRIAPISNLLSRKLKQKSPDFEAIAEDLPIMQLESLRDEVQLYASRGFEYLAGTTPSEKLVMNHHPMPQIPKPARRDFLPLAILAGSVEPPIPYGALDKLLSRHNRQDALDLGEEGRVVYHGKRMERLLTGDSAAIGINRIVRFMSRLAEAHGLNVESDVAMAQEYTQALRSGHFVHQYKTLGRNQLYRLSGAGDPLQVNHRIKRIEQDASRYGVNLDSLITQHERQFLLELAVNHPEKGLRKELVEITQGLLAGETYHALKLGEIDEVVQFSRDPLLRGTYPIIRSAINSKREAIWEAKYRTPSSGLPMATIDTPEPVNLPATPTQIAATPVQRAYSDLPMSEQDATNILSMFAEGNLEKIVDYRIQTQQARVFGNAKKGSNAGKGNLADQARTADDGSFAYVENRRSIGKVLMEGLPVAAIGLALISAFGVAMYRVNSVVEDTSRKLTDYAMDVLQGKIPIEIDCPGTPIERYGPNQAYNRKEVGPKYICKPSPDQPQSKSEMPQELAKAEKPQEFMVYRVKDHKTLTHIVKRLLGEKDEGRAYLQALALAKYNGIKNADRIYPKQEIRIPLHYPGLGR